MNVYNRAHNGHQVSSIPSCSFTLQLLRAFSLQKGARQHCLRYMPCVTPDGSGGGADALKNNLYHSNFRMVYKCIPSAPFVLQLLPGVATGRLHLFPLISIAKVRLLSKWTILFDIYNFYVWIWTLSLSLFQKRMNFNSLLSAVVFLLSSFHHGTSRGKNLWKSGVVNIM